jgi:6-phosphogluconolactonase
MIVKVVRSAEALSAAVASDILQLALQKVRKGGRLTLALAGGSTPRRLYRLLSTEPYCSGIPWNRVEVFWGDERCVPPNHPKSNFRMAQQMLLSRVPVPAGNIHRIPTELRKPEKIAAAYERILRRFFKVPHGRWPIFDLMLVGVGTDGHTASLLPRSPELFERRHLAVAVVDAVDFPRITLTVPVFSHAEHMICMAAGAAKAPILRRVFHGDAASRLLPIRQISPVRGAVKWYLDRAAARLIPAPKIKGPAE